MKKIYNKYSIRKNFIIKHILYQFIKFYFMFIKIMSNFYVKLFLIRIQNRIP